MSEAREELAQFIDTLPEECFDRESFRPLPRMTGDVRRQLDEHVYRYEEQRNALELARKRLKLVQSARASAGVSNVDTNLVIGKMFGALDRIRLQMSFDLMMFEELMRNFTQSAHTQEILEAFQSLIELQGELDGPSPELSSVLDWLRASSTRSLRIGDLGRPDLDVPRSSDVMREAYEATYGLED